MTLDSTRKFDETLLSPIYRWMLGLAKPGARGVDLAVVSRRGE
jgi:hypothetical protein